MPREALSIAPNDLVIIYFSKDNVNSVLVQPGKTLNSRYGIYKHADMVGKRFGCKMPSSNGKGFTYLLKPTPELWTLALSHRTQILYQADIAFITSYLDITPGKTVVEAGTGSGSFSHAVARNIGPSGSLHSFEFHQDRFEQAKAEFETHKLYQIKIQHRNVCKDGFGDDIAGTVDAVFLDLPSPWQAIEFAKQSLKTDVTTRICCFSPCIEQVIRTVTSLGANGFTDITMYEALVREYDPVPIPTTPLTVQQAIEKLQGVELRKESRRQRQMQRAKEENAARARSATAENAAISIGPENSSETKPDGLVSEDAPTAKRQRLEAEPVPVSTQAVESYSASVEDTNALQDTKEIRLSRRQLQASQPCMTRSLPQLRGHTSYLTFATLVPAAKDDSHKTAANLDAAQ